MAPIKLSQRIGKVAYKLELPNNCIIHPVFHVSQLKWAVGTDSAAPPLTADFETRLQPADILKVQQLPSRPKEVLVSWEGLDVAEATWQNTKKFLKAFPMVTLRTRCIIWKGVLSCLLYKGKEVRRRCLRYTTEEERNRSRQPKVIRPKIVVEYN